jgi:large subunit ribosomal protein L23
MLTAMEPGRLYSIIKAPVVTEKSNNLQALNTFVFKVEPNANKQEIKFAVEQIFDVKVKSVRTLNMKGKVKRTGARLGRRQDWKKAYVTLMPGQNIVDVTGAAE